MVRSRVRSSTKVLHQNVVPATEKVARFLTIAPGDKVIDLLRLRSINDEPIQLVTSYIPLSVCPTLATVDLTNRSLYKFMETEYYPGGSFTL
jgi:GntR family transcriptional regulator